MNKMSIPALLALSIALPNLAQAQTVTNAVPEKHQAFKAAKAKLEADIKGFVDAVNACDPPIGKAQIIDGFVGPANKDNALSLLQLRESKVAGHVAEAETKFSAIGGGNIAAPNLCKGGNESFQNQVVAPADAAAKEVVGKLQEELDLYKAGNAVASKNEGMVRKILLARETRIGQLASTQAQLDGCKKALSFLGDDGKNNGALKESDKALQEKLSGLQKAYPERVASIQELGKVLVAGGKCGSLPLRTAAFPSTRGSREGEFQVADLPAEAGAESAR